MARTTRDRRYSSRQPTQSSLGPLEPPAHKQSKSPLVTGLRRGSPVRSRPCERASTRFRASARVSGRPVHDTRSRPHLMVMHLKPTPISVTGHVLPDRWCRCCCNPPVHWHPPTSAVFDWPAPTHPHEHRWTPLARLSNVWVGEGAHETGDAVRSRRSARRLAPMTDGQSALHVHLRGLHVAPGGPQRRKA